MMMIDRMLDVGAVGHTNLCITPVAREPDHGPCPEPPGQESGGVLETGIPIRLEGPPVLWQAGRQAGRREGGKESEVRIEDGQTTDMKMLTGEEVSQHQLMWMSE